MPTKQSLHTFTGGMVLDTDKSTSKPNTYKETYDFRYLANKLGNSGVLYEPEASSVLSSSFVTGELIDGHCVIRDYLILFTHVPDTLGINVTFNIRRYTINNSTITGMVKLYTVTTTVGGVSAGPFSTTETLSCVGRYESSDIIKVYWASKGFPIRVANIAKYLTDSGLEYVVGTNPYLDVNRFNLITNFDVTPVAAWLIDIDKVIQGGLYSGRVQYAVSLIKKNGQETIPSYITNSPINIYSTSINTSPSCNIQGDSESVNAGKGIKLDLTFSSDDVTYFDKYRLYRIHYKEYGQLPEIVIVNDYNLTSTTSTCIDSGGIGLGSVAIEEFVLLNRAQYEAYDLTEKDDRLIAINIEEETFDVEYDARAYRFTSSSGTQVAVLYDHYIDGSVEYTIQSTGAILGGGGTTWEDIPEEANCVNAFNSIANDGLTAKRYMYQSDGITLGGEGPNVSYKFQNTSTLYGLELDDTASDVSLTFNSTNDYGHPMVVKNYTGYQRDEVYRCAILLYNNKGQKSTPKWIGDIRFPVSIFTGASTDESETIVFEDTSDIQINALGLEVTVSNLPTGVTAWQLVRVKRTEIDKTVVRAGAVIDTIDHGDYTWKLPGPVFGATANNRQVINFINPEDVYNNGTIIKSGDYLDIVAASSDLTGYGTTDTVAATNLTTYKFRKFDLTDFKTYTSKRYTVDLLEFIGPTYDTNDPAKHTQFTAADPDNETYVGWAYAAGAYTSAHGRCDVIQLTGAISNTLNPNGSTYSIGYGYIKRNNYGRYGGYTYADRLNNTYIPCGPPTDSSTLIYVYFGGDTYINYMNYVASMYADGLETGTIGITSIYLFPVESTMNLSVSHGILPSRIGDGIVFADIAKISAALIREEAGVYTHPDFSADPFVQDRDLYLYNTVYSQEQNIDESSGYYDEDVVTSFDIRAIYSDYKLDNEYIDSWTIFRPNNYKDVSGTYGPLYKLLKFGDNVYFLQEKAFGIFPINQRALINDNNLGTLELGTGGVLDRYDYIDLFHGTQDKKSADSFDTGLYWVDRWSKSIVRFQGKGVEDLGATKGIMSHLLNVTPEAIPLITGNKNNNEIYITYWNYTLLFNTLSDNFISFYSYKPRYTGDLGPFVFYQISGDDTVYGLYQHSLNKGSFQSNVYVSPSIKLIDNSDYLHTKVYDNLSFATNYKTGNTSIVNGIDSYYTTFNTVTFNNDYQTTGEIELTLEDNLRKRERIYTTTIPRNIVEQNEKAELDSGQTINQTITREFKERMRDKYIEATLTFDNDVDKAVGRFSVDYIIFNYRISIR